MAIYKGIVEREMVRKNDERLRLVRTGNGPSPEKVMVEFPENVANAYVQATNRFPGDITSLGAITIWTNQSEPNNLYFQRRSGGAQWFSFEVET